MSETARSGEKATQVIRPEGPVLGISMVRNEADIIEATIRHNLAYVDHFHIVDDSSSDGTRAILDALAAETGRISIETHDDLGFAKGDLLRKVVRREGKARRAGHVLLLDADEALIGDPQAFRHHVLHATMPLVLPWRTYVPTPDDTPHENPLVRLRHRRSEEKPQGVKRTIPHALIGTVWFDNGFHHMRAGGAEVPADTAHPFALAHFPVRSADQIAAKALIGTWNYRLNPDRPRSNGKHWRKMARQILADGPPDAKALQAMAMAYAGGAAVGLTEDPLPVPDDGGLRYQALAAEGDLASTIIAFTEQLVALVTAVTLSDDRGS